MVCYATGDRPEEKPFDPGLALVAEHNKVTPGFRRSIENLLLDISTLSELGWYVGCRPAQGTHGILQRGLHRVLFLLPDHIQMLANILAVHVHHWHHADHRDFRHVVQRQSRRLAALQTRAALQLGATTVSLGDTLGPEFRARPGELFATDRFHPNAEGYAALAEVLTPAVLSAAGFGLAGLPERYEAPRTERILSAIDQAVEVPGTVVAPILQPRPGERRTLTTVLLRRRG